MGTELRIWSHESPFGGRDLPATVDKDSFGTDERYGVGRGMHNVYLEFESRVCPAAGVRSNRRLVA